MIFVVLQTKVFFFNSVDHNSSQVRTLFFMQLSVIQQRFSFITGARNDLPATAQESRSVNAIPLQHMIKPQFSQ